MNILPTTSHPAFCDPRACKPTLHADGSVSYEHRTGGPALTPAAQSDAEIFIRQTQLADHSAHPWVGDVNVTMVVVDTASSATYGGPPLTIDVDLDPFDARMVAAQLVMMAEQVEATRLAGRRAA